jgi:hypothetical protein
MAKPTVLALCCLLLFASCNMIQPRLSVSAPQGAKDAATEAIKKTIECTLECKDIKVICSSIADVGPADKANGVTEKWCMKISFIYKDKNRWNDVLTDVALSNKSGTWAAEFLGPQFKECLCKKN